MNNNKTIKQFQRKFINSIKDEDVENITYNHFFNCPYCGSTIHSNKHRDKTEYNTTLNETRKKNSFYLRCSGCKVPFVRYSPKHVPFTSKAGLAVVLKIILAPDISAYELSNITFLSQESVSNIKEKYSLVTSLLYGFIEYYSIKDFPSFKYYYEESIYLKEYEETIDIPMPTRHNAHSWLYTYIIDNRNK